MFTSEYDLAMDDDPDCADCGGRLRWVVCPLCHGIYSGYRDWECMQPVRCEHCVHGGRYVCRHCDKTPKDESGQLELFGVAPEPRRKETL